MKIYLAGPLFTTAERDFNSSLAGILRMRGHCVWLPQENEPREKTAHAVFAADLDGIDWCDVVVANMDGPDVDSGTAWECGKVHGRKPVIAFRTDIRSLPDLNASYNLMLWASASARIDMPAVSLRTLATEIVRTLKEFEHA